MSVEVRMDVLPDGSVILSFQGKTPPANCEVYVTGVSAAFVIETWCQTTENKEAWHAFAAGFVHGVLATQVQQAAGTVLTGADYGGETADGKVVPFA